MKYNHNLRIGLQVERLDSKYNPFKYACFYCKQVARRNFINDEVDLFSSYGFDWLFKNMKVGEVRKYWVHGTLSYQSYEGEWDSDFELISIKGGK